MIDFRSLCPEHLVSHCYSRLQECEQQDGFDRIAPATVTQSLPASFLDECRSKIVTLLVHREFTNIDRARLLDILLWASELVEKGRRWPDRGIAAAK